MSDQKPSDPEEASKVYTDRAAKDFLEQARQFAESAAQVGGILGLGIEALEQAVKAFAEERAKGGIYGLFIKDVRELSEKHMSRFVEANENPWLGENPHFDRTYQITQHVLFNQKIRFPKSYTDGLADYPDLPTPLGFVVDQYEQAAGRELGRTLPPECSCR